MADNDMTPAEFSRDLLNLVIKAVASPLIGLDRAVKILRDRLATFKV